MTDEAENHNNQPNGGGRPVTRKPKQSPDAAFELFLERGLHAMYDKVAQEPIPPELLALIEQHRKQTNGG